MMTIAQKDALAAALAYGTLGSSGIPLEPGSKRSLNRWESLPTILLCRGVRVTPSAPGQTGDRLERGHRQALGTVCQDQWQFSVQPFARLLAAELEQLAQKFG